MAGNHKDMTQSPLTGRLNVRSLPDAMADSEFRLRKNMACVEEGKMTRRAGWQRFLFNNNYRNEDLHDQLLQLQKFYNDTDPQPIGAEAVTQYPSELCAAGVNIRTNSREVITFGMEVESSYGSRRLVIGTQSRLYVLNETTGNYRIIADGRGGSTDVALSTRFYGAVLQDNVFFTNNVDVPFYWPIDGAPVGCAMQSTKEIADLALIGLSKASVIKSIKGHLLLMDVVIEGKRYSNRIHWSDFNDGTSHDPAKIDSIAGHKDLDYGEVIVNAELLGNELIVYTKRSIYIGNTTGNPDDAWDFRKIYTEPKKGDKCLAYRNTLVSIGSAHIYAGLDGFYMWDTYRAEPELVDWIDPSSGVIFGGIPTFNAINQGCCDSHIAEFKPSANQGEDGESKGEIWFSWAEPGSCLPSKTIVFNNEFKFVDLVDHGFSMFVNFTKNSKISLRDWILQTCMCAIGDAPELTLLKEPVLPTNVCPPQPEGFAPISIFTDEEMERDGVTTENWEKSEADEHSLCAFLNGATADQYCRVCEQGRFFVAASTQDYCLKQIGTSYNRERCSNAGSGLGTVAGSTYLHFAGTYVADGYYSEVISGPRRYGSAEMKNIIRFMLEAEASDQVAPCVLVLFMGYSHAAYDPLNGYKADPNLNQNASSGSGILWEEVGRQYLQCPLPDSPEALQSDGLNPNELDGFHWPVWNNGKHLYWRLVIASLTTQGDLTSALTEALGGESSYASVTARVRLVPKHKG